MPVHKNAEKAAALRAQIKQIWTERAQRYPLEQVTAPVIQRLLLPTVVAQSTIRGHMDYLRRELAIRRAKRKRAAVISGSDRVAE